MKKQSIIYLGTLLGAGLIFAPTSYAADKETDAVVDYQSGGITFDPQDPNDPRAVLPSNLNFGSHEIQSKADETWLATIDGVQASQLMTGRVAVSDNRGGTGTSWSIKLLQAEQFTAGSNTLEGAALSIYGGALTNNLNSVPTGANIANATLELEIGTTADVLTAQTGEGAGETALALDKFELFVPKTANKKQANYQTTLNWTFSASP